jgi:hypothetical protein
MATEPRTRLSAQEARGKAAQCREDATRARLAEHKTMLEHMAQTWDRIAATLETEH